MIQLPNSEYAALVAERDELVAAMKALQKMDFDLRVDGGAGLPASACKIIDGALDA